MCQIECNRHVIVGFIACVTEHHTLISSPLIVIVTIIYTTIDIVTLLMNGGENTTTVTIKLVFSLCVTNIIDCLTGDCLKINIFL